MNRTFEISAVMLGILVGCSVFYAIWYVESYDVQYLDSDDSLCGEGMTSVIIGLNEDNTLNKKCEIATLEPIYNKNNPTLESTILVGLASSSIVGIGIFLYTTLGYLKARQEFKNSRSDLNEEEKEQLRFDYNGHKLIKSLVVGVISGLILVMPQVQNMTIVPSVENIILSLTLISTVAGLDAIAKKASLPKSITPNGKIR